GQVEALAVEEVGLLLVLVGFLGQRGFTTLERGQRRTTGDQIGAGVGGRPVALGPRRERVVAGDCPAQAVDLTVEILHPLAVRLVLADQFGALRLELDQLRRGDTAALAGERLLEERHALLLLDARDPGPRQLSVELVQALVHLGLLAGERARTLASAPELG